MHINDTLVSTV